MSQRDRETPRSGAIRGGIHRRDRSAPRVVRSDEARRGDRRRPDPEGRDGTGSARDDGAPTGGDAEEPRASSGAGEEATGTGSALAAEALQQLAPETGEATVLCVANQKGGVGKTTTAVSLAAALAGDDVEVLVVDLDPQANATTGLGLRVAEGAPSTYRVLIERLPVEDAAEATGVRGLHVVPSNLDLAGAEIELVSEFARESRLRDALDAVRDLYDVVLIDCPPSLGLLTVNGLVASDQVLVPVQCEYYALEGLGQLLQTVRRVRDGLNQGLDLGGVVLTMYDARTNLSDQVAEEVRDYFGGVTFQTVVPRTVRLGEAPGYGQPIGVFDPSSRGARAYRRLARELADRLGLRGESDEAPQDPLDLLLGTLPDADGQARGDGRDGGGATARAGRLRGSDDDEGAGT